MDFSSISYLWSHWTDIQSHWSDVVDALLRLLGTIVALASIITPLTKTPKDDEMLAGLKNWIHQFSFVNAKNVSGIGQ